MRVVADTNIIVSGLLWPGPSHQLLDAARLGAVTLFTTTILLAELEDVLIRPRFLKRLNAVPVTPAELVHGFAALAQIVEPAAIEPVITADPDDDEVIRCAVAAQADYIISGDSHLLNNGNFREIKIIRVADFLKTLD